MSTVTNMITIIATAMITSTSMTTAMSTSTTTSTSMTMTITTTTAAATTTIMSMSIIMTTTMTTTTAAAATTTITTATTPTRCFPAGVVETTHTFTAEQLEKILTALDGGEYGAVLRAKGIVNGGDGVWYHFDYVPEDHQVRTGPADYTGRLCVIGSGLKEEGPQGSLRGVIWQRRKQSTRYI